MATTSTAATNLFLDVLSSNLDKTQEMIRLEAATFLQDEHSWGSVAVLRQLSFTDSAIKESLRMNPLQSRGLVKQVMPKSGITLLNGTHVPCGTWLGIPVRALQRDPALYPDPAQYNPSRFYQDTAALSNTSQNAAQPSDVYLSFSYGRSAW